MVLKTSGLKKKVKKKVKKKSLPVKKAKKRAVPQSPTKTISPKIELKPKAEKKVFVDSEEIPASYDKTSLTLVARDPYWIYAHWEITPSSVDKIKEEIGDEYEGSVYVLRMYDITYKDFDGNNANHWFDTDLPPFVSNWYINLMRDNATYCGAIGIRTQSGKFHVLARSNFVTTPRANSSWRHDMIWMEVPPFKDDGKRSPSHRPFVMVRDPVGTHQHPKGKKFERRMHLTADDIRAYYYNLFPLLKLLRAKQLSAGKEWGLKRLSQKDMETSFSSFGSLQAGKYYKKIRLGASEEMVIAGGASEQLKGASEQPTPKRNFFFEIGTELIVYGRTEPDAEVHLGDKKIQLREDGTFSLRFALP
ncbi:MAG: DUF4912 domain-containing protein, partial [Candidatus Omnitrophica bacterium]|nr:DUF4912 domain-containing protein [Candidatus Omnitrophota bacterium]